MAANDLHSSLGTMDGEPDWSGPDVLILSNSLASSYLGDVDIPRGIFPTSLPYVTNVLEQLGCQVEVKQSQEDQQQRLRSLDLQESGLMHFLTSDEWMPVLVFASDYSVLEIYDIIVSMIKRVLEFPFTRKDKIKLVYGHSNPNGTVEMYKAEGKPDDVIRVIESLRRK